MKHEEWIPGHTTTNLRANPSRCPTCRDRLDMATGLEKMKVEPEPGCATVCFHCGEIAIFDEHLKLRPPTARELIDLQRSTVWPKVERTQRWIKANLPSPAQKKKARA